MLLVVTVTAASVVLAVPLAWLTTRTDLPIRRVWVVLSALPLVIPSYVAGFIVVAALGPKGMLQGALEGPFGIDRLPDIHGYAGALLTLTFLSFPYVVLTVRAAMLRIDPAMEESSRGLGRGNWTTFFFVTLPLLRPGIAAGGLLVALYTLSDFGAVSLLGYETFTAAIFVEYPEQTRIEGEIQQMPADHPVTELWQVITGQAEGRRDARQITLFDSVGFAIEDFSALRYIRDRIEGTPFFLPLDLLADPDDPRDLFGMLTRAAPGKAA